MHQACALRMCLRMQRSPGIGVSFCSSPPGNCTILTFLSDVESLHTAGKANVLQVNTGTEQSGKQEEKSIDSFVKQITLSKGAYQRRRPKNITKENISKNAEITKVKPFQQQTLEDINGHQNSSKSVISDELNLQCPVKSRNVDENKLNNRRELLKNPNAEIGYSHTREKTNYSRSIVDIERELPIYRGKLSSHFDKENTSQELYDTDKINAEITKGWRGKKNVTQKKIRQSLQTENFNQMKNLLVEKNVPPERLSESINRYTSPDIKIGPSSISKEATPKFNPVFKGQKKAKSEGAKVITTSKKLHPKKRKEVRNLAVLSPEEVNVLTGMLDTNKEADALSAVVNYIRENRHPPFPIFRRLCAWAGESGRVDDVRNIKLMVEKIHPKPYKKNFNFDLYLVSALCKSGDVDGSLALLSSLYKSYPTGHKKIKDMTAFVIIRLFESKTEKQELMALEFVREIAQNFEILSPALSFWRSGFLSSLHRQQQIAEKILDEYPSLLEILHQKIEYIVKQASIEGNIDQLYRILQLVLAKEMKEHYTQVTSALLLLQCDVGDLSGAEETMQFIQTLNIQLNPRDIQRYFALLHYNKRAVPPHLLAAKYGRPPAEPPKPPVVPEIIFKF